MPEDNNNIKKSRNKLRMEAGLVKLLRTAVEQNADEDDWSHLGRVGQYISNKTTFQPVNYGYKKLGDLIRVSDLFEIRFQKVRFRFFNVDWLKLKRPQNHRF